MSDPISQAVQDQYETYPYPSSSQNSFRSMATRDSYRLAQYARTRLVHQSEGKRALIAGCGTGAELVCVSQANPKLAELIGIDLSQRSIEIAKTKVQEYSIQNCQVYQANVMEPDTLPDGPFDLIAAPGVLHHTADPKVALHHLAQRLQPEGVMFLMISSRSGREIIYRTRAALTLLGISSQPDPEAIQFVQDLLTFAQPGTAIEQHSTANKVYYKEVENLVDDFFHPHDIPFDIEEVPPFLDQAGLDFIDVVHGSQAASPPEQVVSRLHHAFHQRLQTLTKIQQLTVLEKLHPTRQTTLEFWCCHKGKITYPSGFDPAFFQNSEWSLNPDVIHAEVMIRGQWHILGNLVEDSRVSIPDAPLKLRSPLIPTPQTQLTLSRFQLCELLLPLAQSTYTGSQLLQQHGPELNDHLLKLFETWELFRLVLRVR